MSDSTGTTMVLPVAEYLNTVMNACTSRGLLLTCITGHSTKNNIQRITQQLSNRPHLVTMEYPG